MTQEMAALRSIAREIVGISYGDLSACEKNIYNYLNFINIVDIDADGDVCWKENSPSKSGNPNNGDTILEL